MKRKIIATLVLIVCIALLISGCTFIKVNDEREANQVIASVTSDGITLNITQLEFMDYLNRNAESVIKNYNYDIDEAVDFLLKKKIESKYIIIKAMLELKKETYNDRHAVTRNLNNLVNPEDILTYGEYFYAIKSVNDEIQSTIDKFIAEYEADERNRMIDAIDLENIEKIEIIEGSFKETYYQKQVVDLSEVKIKITYVAVDDNEPVSIEMPVTDNMYKVPFSTSEAGEKSVVVRFDKKIIDTDGEINYEELTAEHAYEVIGVRATKTKVQEEKDEIEYRYTPLNEIPLDSVYAIFDLDKKNFASIAESEAYRRLKTNLNNQNRSIISLYQAAFESSVLSALNYELGKRIAPIDQATIQAEYEYLQLTSAEVYAGLQYEDIEQKFKSAIGTNLQTTYYYPPAKNIEQYIYVQQILFNFTEEQKAFLNANKGAKELDKANDGIPFNSLFELIGQSITTRESNPDYDPEDEDSLPYATDTEGNIKEKQLLFGTGGIYESLEAELLLAGNAQEKLAIFENYMYRYNDDPGIMNNPTGYLIPPKGVAHGFYKAFGDLAQALYAKDPSVGNAFIEGKLAYCYTDYGVHIIMISLVPFEGAEENGGSFAINKELDLEGNTFNEILKKKLEEQAKTKAYEDFAKLHLSEAENHGKIETKKVDKLLKKIKG